MNDPYAELAELAAAQVRLARVGDVEGLAELVSRREQLAATLPASPPRSARESLALALRLEQEAEVELRMALEQTNGAVRRVQRGRQVTGGYAPPAPQRALTFDTSG